MDGRLLTSAEVGEILGVTAGTVKRWADLGVLACVRTAGRHRRFEPEEVRRFQRERAGAPQVPGRLVDRLLAEEEVLALQADLLRERARLGAWWRVAEAIGPEVAELGRRWQQGEIGIVEEHVASDRLSRALSRCTESLPSRPGAPRVLLAPAEGEEHLIGLALVHLCLREAGWRPLWSGRVTPTAEVIRQVVSGAVDVVALSASLASRPEPLAGEAAAVGEACRIAGVHLVAGGRGPWPDPLPFGRLERTFAGLRDFVAEVERATPA